MTCPKVPLLLGTYEAFLKPIIDCSPSVCLFIRFCRACHLLWNIYLESPKLTDDTQAYNLCPWSYANSKLLLDDAVIIVRGHGHRTAQSGTLVVTQRLYVV